MIDSIDFFIRDIHFLDFNHLRSLGINDIKSFTSKDRLGNENTHYRWSYKGIEFKYNTLAHIVTAITNTHTILDEKMYITLSDRALYKNRIEQIFNEIFSGMLVKYELNRIDYCVDIKFEDDVLLEKYLILYKYQNPKFVHTKIKNIYATSIYRSSGRGQYNLNIYSKYAESKGERYRDILRLELQIKKAKIKKEYEKYGIPKDLDYYWTQEAMEEYYFDFLSDFFGSGKHMKYFKAKELISKSDYSDTWKKKLKKFLKERMVQVDYKNIVKTKKTFNTYAEKLGALNINTLCMFEALEPFFPETDGIDNLLDLARNVANDKYFK